MKARIILFDMDNKTEIMIHPKIKKKNIDNKDDYIMTVFCKVSKEKWTALIPLDKTLVSKTLTMEEINSLFMSFIKKIKEKEDEWEVYEEDEEEEDEFTEDLENFLRNIKRRKFK